MKKAFNIVAAFTLFAASICCAATPQEEARFLEAVRAAISSKDKDAFLAMHCWDRVTEEQKESAARNVDFLFSKEIQLVEIRGQDPTRAEEHDRDGVQLTPNLEVVKVLHIEFPGENKLTMKMRKNIGEKDGKLMFVCLVPKH